MKVIPAGFKRKLNFSEGTQHKNKCPMFQGRWIMYQILSSSNINWTQGHTLDLNDLYNNNLKMLNQVWEEFLLALGYDLDEGVLENLCERQVKKSTLMKNAMTLYQRDLVVKKEPRSKPKLRAMVNDILRHQQQNMLISQKERSKRQSSTSVLFEKRTRKRQRLPLLNVTRFALKRRKCSFEQDPAK